MLVHDEDIRAYLQILQSAISKIGMNSLYCKTLCLTLTASFGFSGKLSGRAYLLSIIIIILCLIVDAIYLSLERSYRNKYNVTVSYYEIPKSFRSTISGIYDMDPGQEYKKIKNIAKSFRSWTIFLVYPVPFLYMSAMYFFM